MQMQLFSTYPCLLTEDLSVHRHNPKPGAVACRAPSNLGVSAFAQRKRLLNRLERGPIDTIAARRDLNIMMPAARIRELRKAGYLIRTTRVARRDDLGREHSHVAMYSLCLEAVRNVDLAGAVLSKY